MVQLSSLPTFAGIPENEVLRLESIMRPETHAAGSYIFREGQEADAFYIVMAGEVAVTKDEWGGKTLQVLGPGDFFGEMGVVEQAPRCASTRAVGDVSLLKVLGTDFRELLTKSPSFALRIMATISRRNRENTTLEEREWGTAPAVSTRQGRVTVVCSMTGGSGVSTATCNLGYELARQSGGKVLLVDGSVEFGDLALMLDMVPAATMAHLAQDPAPTMEAVDRTVLHTDSGVDLLAAPLKPEQADLLSSEFFHRLMPILRVRYDHIVVDTGHGMQEPLPALLEEADQVVYVLTPRLHSLKNARLFMSVLSQLELEDLRVHFILNGAGGPFQSLQTSTIEQSLGKPCFGAVPADAAAVADAVDRGAILCKEEPTNEVSKAFAALAGGLLEGKSSIRKDALFKRPRWLRSLTGSRELAKAAGA
ncbi:MAG: cyclic nucleotide-binding domain-containing protein [Candidatus Wallbacteria bacterium]|nr:cyclic nucleotide-binding domain-containing protein [Candidatus Wallbacteria bacterium]